MTIYDNLTETTLNRVLNHFQNQDIPVAIITTFRDDKTVEMGREDNKVMARVFRSEGYGYVYVDGGWIETQKDGTKKPVTEDSIIVIGNKGDNGKLKGLVKKMIKIYEQDAAMFKEAIILCR